MKTFTCAEKNTRRGALRLQAYPPLGTFVVEIYAPLAGKWVAIEEHTFESARVAHAAYDLMVATMDRRAS